jgi:hypothetical protein
MYPNWTARYAVGMASIAAGGFWLAAMMLSTPSGTGRGGIVAKGVGVFALGVSLAAVAVLLATDE